VVIFLDIEVEEIVQEIEAAYSRRDLAKIKEILSTINPADIAEIFNSFPTNQRLLFFRLLAKEEAADTFVELDGDTQEELIHAFSDNELKDVLDELYLDDAVDIIEEMPATVVKRILKNTDTDTRKSINALLKYPEDSAGSIMTPEFVDLKKDMTVEDAFKRIRRTGVDKETIYTCYVTDNSRHLLGVTTVKELLLHDYDDDISDFMETNVIYINTLDDQEIAAQQLDKYNFLALPVVDMEERLVGIITIDDAMDVMQEENTEDIQKMNAMLPTEKTYLKTTVFETWKSRFPWLLLLMVSATFTGSIISNFEDKLAAMTILTAFIPMLMDTGGNSGGQASVTVIRAMSLGEIEFKNYFKVLWKEIRVGFICGISLAAVNFVKILLIDKMLLGNSEITLIVDLAICLTLVIEIIFAKMIGCTLPMLAKKCGFDPAVMSSPFITTIVDAVSLLIFFGISTAIIPQLH
jgi:magnesium transporter